MLKKISFLFLIAFCSIGFATGYMSWYYPLYPGCHVIDYKRLQQSVQQTAKVAMDAIQTLKMYQSRLLAIGSIDKSKIDNSLKVVTTLSNAQSQLINQATGPLNPAKTATNPSPGTDNQASAWRDFNDPPDKILLNAETMLARQATMLNVASNANYDALKLVKNNVSVSQQLGAEINSITTSAVNGNLGQKQATNIARGYITTMMINDISAENAVDIATETTTKKEIVLDVVAERQSKQMAIGTYDPYNRTSEDNRLNPEKQSIGFPNF